MWNLGDGFACSSQPGGSTRYYDGCVSVTRPCAISGRAAALDLLPTTLIIYYCIKTQRQRPSHGKRTPV